MLRPSPGAELVSALDSTGCLRGRPRARLLPPLLLLSQNLISLDHGADEMNESHTLGRIVVHGGPQLISLNPDISWVQLRIGR